MSDERSAVMDRWFTVPAAGATLMSHLEARCPEFASSLGLGLGELRDDIMPPELLLEQLPHRFKLEHRIYDVSYTPISPRGKIEQLLVVISDVTDSVARETGDREQREVVRIFQRITIDRGGVEEFLHEAGTLVTELRAEHDPVIQKRLVHTLKGNCAIYGMDSYAALAQQVENELADTGGGLSDEQRTILVEMWRQAMRRVASLLGGPRRDIIEIERGELTAARELSAGPELAALLESWTHEPVTRRFERLAMHVGDIARRVGKPEPQIEFQTNGIRLEPEGWTPFWAAMVHVVRNAVDHGIEPETARVAAGKPAAGKITMTASHEDGQLVLKVRDDGRGVDWDRIRDRARKLGLPGDTRDQLIEALFADGVSTKEEVTDLSGRGVGMAALRAAAVAGGGRIVVDSDPSRGTSIRFAFPLDRLGELGSAPLPRRSTHPPYRHMVDMA
jgi:two-component system chemotaxis sensor kinase CheA